MFGKIFLFSNTAWLLGATLLATLLIVAIAFSRARKQKVSLLIVLTTLFYLLAAITLFRPTTPIGLKEAIIYLSLPIAILLLSTRQWPDKAKKHVKEKLPFWNSAVIYAWTVHSLFALVVFLIEPIPRLHGLFQGLEPYTTYPNTLAFTLLLVLPLIWHNLINKKPGYLIKAIFIINAIAFFLTWSRSALIAGLAGVAIWSIALQLTRKKAAISQQVLLTILLVISFLIAVLLNYSHTYLSQLSHPELNLPTSLDISERLLDQSASADQSSSERLQFWLGSIELIKQKPFLGHGAASFSYIYPQTQSELLANAPHPHNFILKIAVENGMLMASLFALILLVVTYKLFRQKQFFLLSVWTAAHVHLMLDLNIDAFLAYFGYLILWVIVLLSISKAKQSKLNLQYLLASTIVITFTIWTIQAAAASQWKNISSQTTLPMIEAVISKYPNFIPALEHEAQLTEDQTLKSEKYQNLIRLDGLNNLELHNQYLSIFKQNKPFFQSRETQDQYTQLIASYIKKLQFNDHNTIASHNPASAKAIIQLFILNSSESDQKTWQSLHSDFQKIWDIESTKFEALFPSIKLTLNND